MIGEQAIGEMREYSSFTHSDRAHIAAALKIHGFDELGERNLDVKENKYSAIFTNLLGGRNLDEKLEDRFSALLADFDMVRNVVQDPSNSFREPEGNAFFSKLVRISNEHFKGENYTGAEPLSEFSAYRFLMERILGARVRPALPSAFCAAAAWPNLPSEDRASLLLSLSEAAATAPAWSDREPGFFPLPVTLDN